MMIRFDSAGQTANNPHAGGLPNETKTALEATTLAGFLNSADSPVT